MALLGCVNGTCVFEWSICSGAKLKTILFVPVILRKTLTKIMLTKQIVSSIRFRKKTVPSISLRSFCSNTKDTDKSDDGNNKRKKFLRQSQGLHAFRPDEIPENPTIVLFPGQGSQFVGMAKSLANIPEAKDMFDIASEVLRFVEHKLNIH